MAGLHAPKSEDVTGVHHLATAFSYPKSFQNITLPTDAGVNLISPSGIWGPAWYLV